MLIQKILLKASANGREIQISNTFHIYYSRERELPIMLTQLLKEPVIQIFIWFLSVYELHSCYQNVLIPNLAHGEEEK